MRPMISIRPYSIEPLEQRIAPAVIVVTSTLDTVERDGVVTLREAIMAANSNSPVGDAPAGTGLDSIVFDIAGAGVHTIVLGSALPAITEGVTIDGTTQPGYAGLPRIAIDGSSAGENVTGFRLAGLDGSVLTGLAIHGFSGDGILITSDGNAVYKSEIGHDPASMGNPGSGRDGIRIEGGAHNIIGENSTTKNYITASKGNGITVTGARAQDNVIQGNSTIRNRGNGIVIESDHNQIGGLDSALNQVWANDGDGIVISGNFNKIQGNRVGSLEGNRGNGIVVSGNHNLIGSKSTFPDLNYLLHNYITYNDGHGLVISGNDNIAGANLIGCWDSTLSNPQFPNKGAGVYITGSNNLLGADNPNFPSGVYNTIAYNEGGGIIIAEGTGNFVLTNRIFANGGTPIDLGGDGSTANDNDDADTGPNNLLNHPIITRADVYDDHAEIEGFFQGAPNSTYTIAIRHSGKSLMYDFATYENIDLRTIVTDESGHASFSLLNYTGVPVGTNVYATASTANGDTSEFSAAFAVQSGLVDVEFQNDRKVTFTDVDGDLVTVEVSKGFNLKQRDFIIRKTGLGGQLQRIDLNASPEDTDWDGDFYMGASLTITATPGPNGGDGFVNVGAIEARGFNMKNVTVDGDLGRIAVGVSQGDGIALQTLKVQSLGVAGLSTQSSWFPTLESSISGSVGKVVIATDMRDAVLDVSGGIKSLTIGGSVHGGTEAASGSIQVSGRIEAAKIGGSVYGGSGAGSGSLVTGTGVNKLYIAGSVFGGIGDLSGTVRSELQEGTTVGIPTIKNITVRGSLFGGDGNGSGAIDSAGILARAVIQGSVIGGDGVQSGAITSSGAINSVEIGHNLIGGNNVLSGSIATRSSADIGKVAVLGSILGGEGKFSSSIISDGRIGKVAVGGEIRAEITNPVQISAQGVGTPANSATAMAIQSVSTRGGATGLQVLAGWSIAEGEITNPDVTIGLVKIGGEWHGGSIVAGVTLASNESGTLDPVAVNGGGNPTIVSSIARIVVAGAAYGTQAADDAFAFAAERISAVSIDGRSVPVDDSTPIGIDGDFEIRTLLAEVVRRK